MTQSTSFLTRPLLAASPSFDHFSDHALSAAMVAFEVALAQAQADLGVIPAPAAKAIAGLADVSLPIDTLEDGVRAAGVPVPALVAALRSNLAPEHADWVHFGATSQDVIDTAMCLCAGKALDDLDTQLSVIIAEMAKQSALYQDTIMLARTRGQLATPITFGLRVAQWAQPLIALQAELGEVRRTVLRIQLGGASGSQSALAPHGSALSSKMAQSLGLADSAPWHTDRNGIRKLGTWLARVVQATAKIGLDLATSARNEIAEASAGPSGGSSTMPHKSNPVLAEGLQSLAILATVYETGLSASAVHGEERDGVMWPVEWALLPALFETAAAALDKGQTLISTLRVDAARMAARIEDMPDVMAEAAVFALSQSLGRSAATARVKAALAQGQSLRDVIAAQDGLDPNIVFDAAAFTTPASAVARAIFDAKVPTPEP